MTTKTKTESDAAFQWECQPAAAALVHELVDDFCHRSPAASALRERLLRETGTRLIDWVDHLAVNDVVDREALAGAGFEFTERDGVPVAEHAGGMFPTLRLDGSRFGMAFKVESVLDFLAANGLKDTPVEGAPWSRFRSARIAKTDDTELWVVERHGYRGFAPHSPSPSEVADLLHHEEAFRCRQRRFMDETAGFDHAKQIAAAASGDLGVDRACEIFFRAERDYWMSRNRAGRLQRARQDMLGLGWANHDHHTYRSSRENFSRLIALMESLGVACRERFYAGTEAGWGAQVMEQPNCQVMVFADVDLSPEEVAGDFAHQPLAPREHLGTVGLWCALHGEAVLQAGMHHLEAQFDFTGAREQLAREGIKSMAPFTDFGFLRQSFTQGETWPVEPARIAAALASGSITQKQADQFAARGAIGSHLEILERNEGYKGFNQTGISQIIRRTDPRTQAVESSNA
jgi:hypothetical protein